MAVTKTRFLRLEIQMAARELAGSHSHLLAARYCAFPTVFTISIHSSHRIEHPAIQRVGRFYACDKGPQHSRLDATDGLDDESLLPAHMHGWRTFAHASQKESRERINVQ